MGANICECGDPQSQHRASKYGCRALECVCTKYVLDIPATKRALAEADHGPVGAEVPATMTRPVSSESLGEDADEALARDLDELEAADPQVHEAAQRLDDTAAAIVRQALGGESTSAKLHRVEQERDEAKAALTDSEESRRVLLQQRDAARAELSSARQELDQRRQELDTFERVLEGAIRERDDARALVEAMARAGRLDGNTDPVRGIEALRAAWVDADRRVRELANELNELHGLVEKIPGRTPLEVIRDLLAEGESARSAIEAMRRGTGLLVPAAAVLYQYRVWVCQPATGCGTRYSVPQPDHECGPLDPQVVTVTRQPNGATT